MKLRVHHSATVAHEAGRQQVVIIREPWWTAALLAAAESVCATVGHRLCATLVKRAFALSERHAQRFALDCSAETVTAYRRWRGWADDEDGQEGLGGSREPLPEGRLPADPTEEDRRPG